MIGMQEMLCGNVWNDIPVAHQHNLTKLLEIINKVRQQYNHPMSPSNSYRTWDHHIQIYKDKAEKAGTPFDESKVPTQSKHLFGQAVDIIDKDGHLKTWLRANTTFLRAIGIWIENLDKTPEWCHLQIVPYGSYSQGGSLEFNP